MNTALATAPAAPATTGTSPKVVPLRNDEAAQIDSIISAGAEFEGDILANKGIRIDGHLRGNITLKNQEGGIVVVAAGGQVTGNITAPNVVLETGGTIKGNIIAVKAVDLNGVLEGDLEYSGKISVGGEAEICGMIMTSKRKLTERDRA